MKRITVPEEGIETLFGSYDENLKHLESLFNVRIRTQGHELLVDGDTPGPENVDRVVGQLSSLMRDGYKLSNADVKTASDLVAQDQSVDLREHFLKGSLTPAGKRRVAPKTINQRRYLDAIEANDIVFGIGPAGTGKTYLAMAQAVSFLVAKKVSRIILARPAVEAGEKLGFLPGDLQEKVNPYLRPLYDALYDMLDVERVARYIERGTIEIAPIAFMRGRTLNDSFVILDEAQNTTSEQMKMFLTRLGFGAKAVITGDITQIDLPAGRVSGLVEAMKVVGAIDGISFIYFDDRDVVRHKLVQQIVKAYEAFSNGNRPALERSPPCDERRPATTRPARARRLQVAVTDGLRPGHAAARAWRRWLARVAPARARGTIDDRAGQRRADARAEPPLSRPRLRDRRAQFPRPGRSRPPRRPAAERARPFPSRRHRHRPGRRAPAGAGGRARRADRASDSGAARPAAPAWDTITSATTVRWRGWSAGCGGKGGLREGLIERALHDSPAASSSSACAAVYLGAIEAAFSALMRLSLRLVAERSGRPGHLAAYLDDPVLLFVPVRLLLGLVTAAATALLAPAIGASSVREADAGSRQRRRLRRHLSSCCCRWLIVGARSRARARGAAADLQPDRQGAGALLALDRAGDVREPAPAPRPRPTKRPKKPARRRRRI